jgi:hypothetical protein
VAAQRSIQIYYEHPDWFRPLFAELERRGVPHERIDAGRHAFDPTDGIHEPAGSELLREDEGHEDASSADAPLVFNRMSPSAWKRGRADAILYTLHWLRSLDLKGVPVVNGVEAFIVETSKALQISLIERLGLIAPRTRVVNHPAALPAAALELEFPLVVKPNIGGSGAGIVRFDSLDPLVAAVESDAIPRSLDGILLLQEFHPPEGGSIVRVETLEGRYLYGIRVHIGADAGFDLCPADICRDVKGARLETAACPAGAAKSGLSVEAFVPPFPIRREVERIARASSLDVGGIEYLDSERDGRRYYYDVNALSNFVADPVRVVGFDPTVQLVDVLVERARLASPASCARREHRPQAVSRTRPAGPGHVLPLEDHPLRVVGGLVEEIAPAALAASESIVAPLVRHEGGRT